MGLFQAVEILLKNNADPNIPSNDGKIPLHNAVAKKDLNLMNLLLVYKSNPNAKNKLYFQTPLHIAMKNSVNLSIIDSLISHGGDLNIKDKYDKSPFDYIQLEETKNYILNLLKDKNSNENIKNNPYFKTSTNSYNNMDNKNESIGKFLTPSKDEVFDKEFYENTENKVKFETDISIIEKNNICKINNFNLDNNGNNTKDNLSNNNFNNINTNFLSGLKNNNMNFSEILQDTEKNYKLDISYDKRNKNNFLDNNAFDLSLLNKKNKNFLYDHHDNYENLNRNLNTKFDENKSAENDKYTLKLQDSNKFSLSDFQIINNKNFNFIDKSLNQNNFNIKDSLESPIIDKIYNKNNTVTNHLKILKPNNKDIFVYDDNDYATFEKKYIEFDKIDLNNNYSQNTNQKNNNEENIMLRISNNTQNTDILNQYNTNNTNNTNNIGEKPKTPKSVFSPMTFFRKNNNNTNSKSGSNSKINNVFLLSEKKKNTIFDKEINGIDNHKNLSNQNNYINSIKIRNGSIKHFNSNSNMNTAGSNTKSNNFEFSDRKLLNNDNEYILDDNNYDFKNNILNTERNDDGKKFAKCNSDNNVKINLNKNFESKNSELYKKEKINYSPSNYQSNSIEEHDKIEKNRKIINFNKNDNSFKKDFQGDFSGGENYNNSKNLFYKMSNINNSNLTLKNKIDDGGKDYRENMFKEPNFSDYQSYENHESESISNINAENHNNNFYYNERDVVNENIIKTGNYESFISRDHSRNSFIFLTNRQSSENNNRSYCRSAYYNEW